MHLLLPLRTLEEGILKLVFSSRVSSRISGHLTFCFSVFSFWTLPSCSLLHGHDTAAIDPGVTSEFKGERREKEYVCACVGWECLCELSPGRPLYRKAKIFPEASQMTFLNFSLARICPLVKWIFPGTGESGKVSVWQRGLGSSRLDQVTFNSWSGAGTGLSWIKLGFFLFNF